MYKRFLSMVFALALMLACARFSFVQAAGNELYLEIAESGGEVTVMLKAGTELTFGGISGNYGYDRSAFELVNAGSGALAVTVNAGSQYFIADTAYNLTVPEGTCLFEIKYRKTSSFDPSDDHTFVVDLESAYNYELEEYAWSIGSHMAAVLYGTGTSATPESSTVRPTATASSNTPAPIKTDIPTATAGTQTRLPTAAPDGTDFASQTNTPYASFPAATPAVSTQSPGYPDEKAYSVVYTDTYGKVMYVVTVAEGECLVPPNLPDGCDIWVYEGRQFDFTTPIHEDMILCAGSTEVNETEYQSADPDTTEENAKQPLNTETDADATSAADTFLNTSEPTQNKNDEKKAGDSAITIAIATGVALCACAAVMLIVHNKKKPND